MKKFFSISLKILIALVLIIAVVLISLPFIIDPNDYKDEIAQQVKQHTGRTLHIPGDITLSVFPWLGVQLGEVALENAAGFKPKNFARMDEVDVRVQLLPLLKTEIKIGHVSIRGLELNLQRDAKGRSNWDDLLQKPQAAPAPEQVPVKPEEKAKTPAPAKAEASPAAMLAALSIEGITLSDARLSWADAQKNQAYQVDKLEMEMGRVSLSEAIPVELGFDFNSAQPAANGRLALKTEVKLDLENNVYTLNDLTFAPKVNTTLLPGAQLSGQITTPLIRADMNKQWIKVDALNSELRYQTQEPALTGELQLNTRVELNLAQQHYTLSKLALHNQALSALLPGGRAEVKLNTPKLVADLNTQRVNSEALAISAYGLSLNTTVNASQILGQPRYQARLNLADFNPRDLMQKLALPPLTTADNTVLKRAKLSAEVNGTLDSLSLKPLALQLDDSQLKGQISVSHFQQPAIRYQLALDAIDVDRYLPTAAETDKGQKTKPSKTAPGQPATPAAAAAGGAGALPLDLLRQLDVKGLLDIQKLKAANLRVTDLHLGTQAQKGLIHLKPMTAKLYEGHYSGTASLNVQRDTPRLGFEENLSGVQIGPLLKDLIGDDKIRGKTAIKAKLSARSLDPMGMRQTLNGTARFVFENGAIKGFKLSHYERVLRAKLKGQPAPKDEGPLETDFARLSGSFNITNGVAKNEDLAMSMPHARVHGRGHADLAKERLDYALNMKFTSSMQGQGGKTYAQMDKIPLPVYIRGPFTEPQIKVDYEAVLKALAKQELKKQEEKLKQKAEEKLQQEKDQLKQELQEKAKEKLKKLFKF